MWTLFHWSRGKELFPSSTRCRQVRHSDGVYLETCFLLKSCWQGSISCGSNQIRYRFGHQGFSNGWDSWLRASSSPFASFSHAYYIILHWLKIELYSSTVFQSKTEFLEEMGESTFDLFCSEILQQSKKRITNGLFSFLVPHLYCLFSNTIWYIHINIYGYTHNLYSVYIEWRNHHPDSTTGDHGPVLSKLRKETNQNRQLGKREDRQNSFKWEK